MYLDRTYRPKRRRGRWSWWPIIIIAVVAIVLYEQQPTWLIDRSPPPTPTPLFSASKYLNDAAIALESNDFEAVRTAYEALVETRPTEPTSYIRLAELSLMNQKVEDSLSYAQRAVEVAPDNPDALAALARAYDWQGEYDTALQFALDGFDIDPLNPNVLAVLGEIYTDNLNFPTAQEYLDAAYELAPRNTLVLRNMAWQEETQSNYEEALEWYEAALQEAPYRYDIHMERGRQYGAGLNNYEEAVKSYQKAVDIYPSPLTLDALGYTQFLLGDPLIAIRTLDDAIELDPTYGLAYIHRGLVYYARLNYEDAAPDLEIGVRLLGDKARVEHVYSLGLALIYQEEQDCEKAIPWLRKALEIDKNSTPALSGLSECNAR